MVGFMDADSAHAVNSGIGTFVSNVFRSEDRRWEESGLPSFSGSHCHSWEKPGDTISSTAKRAPVHGTL